MKTKTNLKKTLAAICVLALLIGVLPASVFAEEMVEIPESDYVYVNGDSKVVTLEGEDITVLRLIVENPGLVHILASGVNMKLAVFDETDGSLREVYSSENGLMDAELYAAPGSYLLGLSGDGEVEVRAADEEKTSQIYAGVELVVKPAEEPVEDVSETDTEDVPEGTSEDMSSDALTLNPEGVPEEPEAPAFDPSVAITYKAEIGETVSVLEILQDAGASVEAVTYVSGNIEGNMVSSSNAAVLGDWLITPCSYFESVELTVKTVEDITYTLVVSCPAPVEEAAPADAAPAADASAPAAESPAEDSAVPADAVPAADAETPVEEFVEAQPEETVEEVIEEVVEAQPEETAEEVIEEVVEAQPEETVEEVVEEVVEAQPEEAVEEVVEEVVEAQPEETVEEVIEEAVEAQPEETVEEVVEEVVEAQPEETVEEVVEAQPEETVEEVVETPVEETVNEPETEEKETGLIAGFVNWLVGGSPDKEEEEPVEAPAEDIEEVKEAEEVKEEVIVEEVEEPVEETEKSVEEIIEEVAEAPAEESVEEIPEEPSEESLLTTNYSLLIEDPIVCPVTTNEQITLLPVLMEAGAPVNTITSVTGEVGDRAYLYNQGNGDWVVTPFAYFDSIELTVTATDYLAADPAAAEAVYTVVLTNPDPNPVVVVEEPAEEVKEAAEDLAEEVEVAEPEEDTVVEEVVEPVAEPLPEIDVTIAVERQEDNAVRLFAENVDEEADESYAYQWQYSLDGEEWLDVEGATEKDYNFRLDETTGKYYWRLIVSYN